MSGPRTCRNCKFCGWDPDGFYCASPKIKEKYGDQHPFGLDLESQKLATLCSDPDRALFEAAPSPLPTHEESKNVLRAAGQALISGDVKGAIRAVKELQEAHKR